MAEAEETGLDHVRLVAGIFRALSFGLGLPSGVAFLFLGWESARLHLLPPGTARDVRSGDQFIDLFVAGFQVFGKLFELFAGTAKWAITFLAVASLLFFLFAVVLFLTARGIHAGRSWAKGLGIVFSLPPLAAALTTAATAYKEPLSFAISVSIAATAAYVIWTLGRKFGSSR